FHFHFASFSSIFIFFSIFSLLCLSDYHFLQLLNLRRSFFCFFHCHQHEDVALFCWNSVFFRFTVHHREKSFLFPFFGCEKLKPLVISVMEARYFCYPLSYFSFCISPFSFHYFIFALLRRDKFIFDVIMCS
ncbi:hypothetical protein V8G54_030398, partial [Vigna mungo]